MAAEHDLHRAFGWEALDALLSIPGVQTYASQHLERLLDNCRSAYVISGEGPMLTEMELQAGLLDVPDYAALFERCEREVLRPRFAARGI